MTLLFIIQFLLSSAAGFLFWKVFSGKHEGDRIERSIRPKIGQYRLHIHHWLWCATLLAIFLVCKFYHPIVLGILVGSIIQGLSYRDRFIIIYRDKDFERIYSKYRAKSK
jgi:cytochrome bd-type quinol oxidase subunit 2